MTAVIDVDVVESNSEGLFASLYLSARREKRRLFNRTKRGFVAWWLRLHPAFQFGVAAGVLFVTFVAWLLGFELFTMWAAGFGLVAYLLACTIYIAVSAVIYWFAIASLSGTTGRR
jgi:hypothetical protein